MWKPILTEESASSSVDLTRVTSLCSPFVGSSAFLRQVSLDIGRIRRQCHLKSVRFPISLIKRVVVLFFVTKSTVNTECGSLPKWMACLHRGETGEASKIRPRADCWSWVCYSLSLFSFVVDTFSVVLNYNRLPHYDKPALGSENWIRMAVLKSYWSMIVFMMASAEMVD